MFKHDVRCAPRGVVHREKCNCYGIPSPGRSGSSQIISCWGTLNALRAQEGWREEKRWTPLKCSSALFLQGENDTFGKTKIEIHGEYIKNQSNTLTTTQTTLYGLYRIKDEFTWVNWGSVAVERHR